MSKVTLKQESIVFDRAREFVSKEYNRVTLKSNGKVYESKHVSGGSSRTVAKDKR